MTLSLLFKPQDPTAVIDYDLDFTDEVAENAPLTLTALSWSVLAIFGDVAPLTIVSQANLPDFSGSTVRVTGGTLGLTYLVRCARTWSDGERDVVSFELPVGIT